MITRPRVPAVYTRAEQVSDAAVHAIGLVSAVVAVAVLITLAAVWAGDAPTMIAASVYGISLIGMFVCSAIYNMSKYAVEGITNTLRYELAPFGIQATSIEPGAVATGMTANPVEGTARIWERTPPEIRSRYEAKIRPITDDLGRRLLDSNDPDAITDEVLALVDAPVLKPRYMVGKEVKMLPLMQRLLSESAFERLIAKQFNIQ